MRKLKSLVWAGGLGFIAACASIHDQPTRAAIELPATTPFDANVFARRAYLDAYEDGYRSAERGGEFTPRYERGPYPLARELGWRAGAAAVYNAGAGSEKVKE